MYKMNTISATNKLLANISIVYFKGNCYPLMPIHLSYRLHSSIIASSLSKGSSYSNLTYNCKSYFKGRILRQANLSKVSLSLQKRNFSFKESFESAVVAHTGFFKWISESAVVERTQHFIIQIHDSTGLPWWLSIILTTFVVRTLLTFPLALYQACIVARLENLRKEMDEIVNNIKYDLNRDVRRNKWPEKKAQRVFRMSVRKEWTRLIERDNCHPAKTAILAMVQVPLWITFSTAFRNLVYRLPYNDPAAQLKCLELSVGGVAWFPDLTVPDSFVIPIAVGLFNLAIIEIQTMMHKGERSRLQRYATNFFRGLSILMIPVTTTVPSCIALYWASSSMFGLFQTLMVLSPRLRRVVGIPSTPTTITHPYAHLAQQFSNKFRK